MRKISRRLLFYTLWAILFSVYSIINSAGAHAATGINQQLNFQGRLLNSQGAVVADGYYNMEFKIYQDGDGQSAGDTTGSPAGSLKWTEDWLNTGTTQGVQVKNGYLSVQLGSRAAFGTSVNWNSDTLWLSMQVGNTSTCTISTSFQTDCGGDGEMTPMKRLSSTPYALDAGMLNGLTSADFLQLAQGVQTDTSAVNPSLFINKANTTGTPNIIEVQKSGQDVMAVDNSGSLILGTTGTGGINGKLVFNTTNTNNTAITLEAADTTASYSLILPTAAPDLNQCLATDASIIGQLDFVNCPTGTYLAKNATDTSSASVSSGNLYTFTNTNSAASTGVLSLDNGTNTGSTFSATTSGNPVSGSAVIYAQNTNASPSGNLIDLEAGTTPSSKFSVNASGDIVNASNKINSDTLSGSALTFGGASAATIQSAASQALNITGHANSTWSLDAGNLTLQTSGAASTLALDAGTSGNGTITIGTNANSITLGTGTGSQTVRVGNSSGTNTIAIGTASSAVNTITIGTANSSSSVSIVGGASGSINVGSTGTAVTASTTNIGTTSNSTGTQTVNIGSNAKAANAVTIESGNSGGINIGSSTAAHTINIGNGGTNAQNINLGSTSSIGTTTISAGANGTNGTLVLQTSSGGVINVGAINGSDTVNIGSSSLTTGTQAINIGNNNTSGGTTNITIGAGGSATGGTTAIQSKGNTTVATNGTLRATFDSLNNLYLGNGTSNAAPNNFAITGTSSSTSGTTGGSLTVKGGDSTAGNTNGGNLILSGGAGAGTGVSGSVIVKSNGSNSTTAFEVQKSDSTPLLVADTSNALVGLGAAPTAGGALVQVSTTLSAGTSVTSPSLIATTGVYTGASGGTQRIDASGNLLNIGNITGSAAVNFQGGAGTAGATGGNGGSVNISGGAGGNGTTTNGNGGDLVLAGGAAGGGAGTAGTGGSVIVKNPANSTAAFQVQNSTNSKAVLAVDTTNNQIVLGTPGVGGLTGQIKLYYAGSTGSITLATADPGSSNYTLTIPSGGGTICTTGNNLCTGSGGGATSGLAKNAVDTSSADAGTGYLYTFTNTGNAESGGVLSLDNGNNTGSVEFLKGTSSTALRVQNASSYDSLVLDTASTNTHLKVYDGTATAAYADISYNDSSSSAIFVASAGTTQLGGGSAATLLTAGSGKAVNITGHTDSNWVLDSGNLTIDVTGTNPNLNIGTGAQAKTVSIGNQTGTTGVSIASGTGNISFIPVGTSNSGVIIKPTNASGKALQIQNSTSSKDVMYVDNSNNIVNIGDGSSSGITGQLAFNYAGASGTIILKASGSPGASTYTLQLPDENGTLCTTAGSAACLAVYGGGTSGNFLAKNAVDTSSADPGAGSLYTFTNSGSGGSGNVVKFDNGNNTGSTLIATTSGNPGAGKAVIYGANTNASPTGNLIDLEVGATPSSVFSVDTTGQLTAAGTSINGTALTFGGASAATIQPAASQALNITGHADSTWSLDAGSLTIQTSSASSNLTLDSGTGGIVALGATSAGSINIGNLALASGTQNINIGTNNTSGGTTNVTIGSGASATDGTTAIQSKDNTTIATNGITRATFDTAGHLFLGNGATNASPANFTISGTGSATSGTAGSSLTIQGGNATVGNANGGNITITGGTGAGTGVNGLVMLTTPTFTTVNDPNCYTGGSLVTNSCTIAASSVNGSSAILVGFSTEGQVATLPGPTITTPGRIVYVTAANSSKDFTLEVNGGGTGNDIAMRQNTSATMIWNGSGWTAAGASSSTTLQAAYDNTLQSAGGAELVVSHTTATNGLTIRDSSVNPVNGTLLSVQTNSAATIISVNGNVTEYASDAGAETAGNTDTTFPAASWSAVGAASVSRYTTVGNFIATGEASVSVGTTTAANDGAADTLSSALTSNMHYNVSFAARLASGTFTDMNVYYSVDGTTASVACTTSQIIATSVWSKVNCTFAAPASGITANNAILIRQTGSGTARSFYIDNLSVTIGADYNYATDGSVDDDTNFPTNWTAVGSDTVSRSTTVGNDASDSAEADTTGAGQGVRNKLAINPLKNTLYRVTVYAASSSAGFNSFTVSYSPNGGTNSVNCADYNTQSISSSTTDFTEVTCYITTDSTSVSSPYVYFTQTDSTARTFFVDTFSMTLSTDTTPNVQIGGGINGGPVTLLTLDRAASAPIASNNDAFLGSMYYDTSLGELQCYEADGWGSCGSSPNTVVTISPEFTNAVMHGTGIGTMNSDICSGTLHLNDGTSGQPTICGSSETYNFYKWTSPQASAQTYSIYVTYQLPDTFKVFASGKTSIMGRTDSNNATVQYSVYREDASTGLTQCGPVVPVSTGSVSSWQIGVASGAADPSTCGFAANDSILFKIDVVASQDADAYVGNLDFTFSHK